MDSLDGIARYDSAAITRGRRDQIRPCAIQPRDLAIVEAVNRHKFLNSPQLLELWWPGKTPQAGCRRLTRLFEAGLLDRFRPVATRGSFPWTYQLGREGHRLLQDVGSLPRGKRFTGQDVYDYRYVLHEMHLNAWVLSWRRLLGSRLLSWEGERLIDPPRGLDKPPLHIGGDFTADGLHDTYAKQIRPDDFLEVDDEGVIRTFLIEYDRTRRVDKNFEKFRRYDTFLCWWRLFTDDHRDGEPPVVLFICQDSEHRDLFLEAADHELTGHHWHPYEDPNSRRYIGRRNVLFVLESEMHAGSARCVGGEGDITQRGRSRRCYLSPPTRRSLDARRPRPAADCGVLHRRRSPA